MDLGVRAMLGASLQERYGGISGSVPEGLCVNNLLHRCCLSYMEMHRLCLSGGFEWIDCLGFTIRGK